MSKADDFARRFDRITSRIERNRDDRTRLEARIGELERRRDELVVEASKLLGRELDPGEAADAIEEEIASISKEIDKRLGKLERRLGLTS